MSYLGPSDPQNPGGRNDNSSVSPQRAGLFDVLQHETRHFAVILGKEKRDREKTQLLSLPGTTTFSSQLPHASAGSAGGNHAEIL